MSAVTEAAGEWERTSMPQETHNDMPEYLPGPRRVKTGSRWRFYLSGPRSWSNSPESMSTATRCPAGQSAAISGT